MPRSLTLIILLTLLSPSQLVPQTNKPPERAMEPHPEDGASIDSIIKALYDVISGPAGEKRDLDRFRALFVPDSHLIPMVPGATGGMEARVLTPESFIERSQQRTATEGFWEREVARRTEQFAHIAHVFTTYESRRQQDGQPFARGINSIQLMNDGRRWWIVNIIWEAERPGSELPQKYLQTPR